MTTGSRLADEGQVHEVVGVVRGLRAAAGLPASLAAEPVLREVVSILGRRGLTLVALRVEPAQERDTR